MIYDFLETDLTGPLVVASDEKGLRHLNFVNGRYPVAIGRSWRRDKGHFKHLKSQLADYFSGSLRSFDVLCHLQGTPFQMRVWQALRAIPYGQVVSYQWVADRIGRAKAVRAVGAANARNPISIIFPCHRVIGKNGRLTGYGGGLDVKRRLLCLENPAVTFNA